ncbi:ETEC_3214 domain-containing protein [Rhodococcoides fascians]|uniref:ETEC_3214 domain-containing protein n=1 Tax=Rhodococcoides fascians TaxID=1828 RepID=UPI000A76141E|nr:ETEC_3214 domain-containing protein [Rhodococcus fascians]
MSSFVEYVSQGIAVGTGFAALLSTAWAGYLGCRRLWQRTIGRRREQQGLIETLACGSSREFVNSTLGVPRFRSETAGIDRNTYSTAGAWVVVEFESNTVIAFSVTVTNPRLYVTTDRLCFSQLKVQLGRSTFAVAPDGCTSEKLWTGAHRHGYLRHYYFGNPAGYQNYWLSYNMCGSGSRKNVSPDSYESGAYGDRGMRDQHIDAVSINTLTVVGPTFPNAELFFDRDVLGPENDIVRLAVSP